MFEARLTSLFLVLAASVAIVTSADELGPYRKLGSTVVISAGPVTDPVTSITWKHGPDIAAEWFGEEVSCYRHFKDRCQLDTTTGDLTIKDVTREDSGSYTPEISNRVRNPVEIQIIAAVPMPTVATQWGAGMTHYILTCEGNITDAGQVKYFWTQGDMVVLESKELIITRETLERYFKCSLENPVSRKYSETVENPFIGRKIYALFVIPIIVFPIILFVVYKYRQRIKEKLNLGRCCKGTKREEDSAERAEEGTPMLQPTTGTENSDTNLLNGKASPPVQASTGIIHFNTETESAQIHQPNTGTEESDTNLLNGKASPPVQASTGTSDTSTETENPNSNLLDGEASKLDQIATVTSDTSTETEESDTNLLNEEASPPVQTSTVISDTSTETEESDTNLLNGNASPPVQTSTGISDTSTETENPNSDGEASKLDQRATVTSDTSTETENAQTHLHNTGIEPELEDHAEKDPL